jgi:hypothetical protein
MFVFNLLVATRDAPYKQGYFSKKMQIAQLAPNDHFQAVLLFGAPLVK